MRVEVIAQRLPGDLLVGEQAREAMLMAGSVATSARTWSTVSGVSGSMPSRSSTRSKAALEAVRNALLCIRRKPSV